MRPGIRLSNEEAALCSDDTFTLHTLQRHVHAPHNWSIGRWTGSGWSWFMASLQQPARPPARPQPGRPSKTRRHDTCNPKQKERRRRGAELQVEVKCPSLPPSSGRRGATNLLQAFLRGKRPLDLHLMAGWVSMPESSGALHGAK